MYHKLVKKGDRIVVKRDPIVIEYSSQSRKDLVEDRIINALDTLRTGK